MMNVIRVVGAVSVIGITSVQLAAASEQMPVNENRAVDLLANKKLVTDFYDLAFNRHQAKKAALLYLNESYIQHNPHVASSRSAFIQAFDGEDLKGSAHTDFIRVIAEGDLVILHSHKTKKRTDLGRVGIDLFRIEQGKIAEHWDVNQDIPEKTASGNTVY